MCFIERKYLIFKQNVIDIFSICYVRQLVGFDEDNDLEPYRLQAITWNNGDIFHINRGKNPFINEISGKIHIR